MVRQNFAVMARTTMGQSPGKAPFEKKQVETRQPPQTVIRNSREGFWK